MLVKCIRNKISEVDQNQLNVMRINCNKTSDYQFGVTVGEEYLVYGIALVSGVKNYLLCYSDGYRENVGWMIEDLFVVSDGAVSKCWVERDVRDINTRDLEADRVWLHKNLASICNVYTSFSTGENNVVDKFYEIKHFFDIEFSYVVANNAANRIDEHWLMCPNCDHVWEQNTENVLEYCCNCKTILNRS
ncbi:MAG: hypothetical protein COA38_19810 [Fluviicola sp.]|nr:MAG: hypothetical protein COA38_19810 [Fluviicola sp.]